MSVNRSVKMIKLKVILIFMFWYYKFCFNVFFVL